MLVQGHVHTRSCRAKSTKMSKMSKLGEPNKNGEKNLSDPSRPTGLLGSFPPLANNVRTSSWMLHNLHQNNHPTFIRCLLTTAFRPAAITICFSGYHAQRLAIILSYSFFPVPLSPQISRFVIGVFANFSLPRISFRRAQ